jgi:hypothetical protein
VPLCAPVLVRVLADSESWRLDAISGSGPPTGGRIPESSPRILRLEEGQGPTSAHHLKTQTSRTAEITSIALRAIRTCIRLA